MRIAGEDELGQFAVFDDDGRHVFTEYRYAKARFDAPGSDWAQLVRLVGVSSAKRFSTSDFGEKGRRTNEERFCRTRCARIHQVAPC